MWEKTAQTCSIQLFMEVRSSFDEELKTHLQVSAEQIMNWKMIKHGILMCK